MAAAAVVGVGWQSDAVSTMACFHKGDFVAVEGFVSFSFWGVLSGHSWKVWSLKQQSDNNCRHRGGAIRTRAGAASTVGIWLESWQEDQSMDDQLLSSLERWWEDWLEEHQ